MKSEQTCYGKAHGTEHQEGERCASLTLGNKLLGLCLAVYETIDNSGQPLEFIFLITHTNTPQSGSSELLKQHYCTMLGKIEGEKRRGGRGRDSEIASPTQWT